MGILIKHGRLIDAAVQMDRVADLYMDDGLLVEIGTDLETREKNPLRKMQCRRVRAP